MFHRLIIVVVAALLSSAGPLQAATDYLVFIQPSALITHEKEIVQIYYALSPADQLSLVAWDGQVLARQTGLRRLASGVVPAPEVAKLRAFIAGVQKAASTASAARTDDPLGCLRALATATMGAPKVDRRVAIILGVSPLQVFPSGPDQPYSCAADVYPGDGLLVTPSPYHADRKDLAGLDVVWQMPEMPDSGAVFKAAITRFWLHHLQLRGARALLLDGTVEDALRVGSQPRVAFDERRDALKKDQEAMIRVTTTVTQPIAPPIAPPVSLMVEDTATPAVPELQQTKVVVPEIPKSAVVSVPPPVKPDPPMVSVLLLLWDHKAVDGDRVALWLDGQPLRRDLILGAEPVRVELRVTPGEHRLVVEALDDGVEGPATMTASLLLASDGSTVQEDEFSIEVGEKGELIFALHAAN